MTACASFSLERRDFLGSYQRKGSIFVKNLPNYQHQVLYFFLFVGLSVMQYKAFDIFRENRIFSASIYDKCLRIFVTISLIIEHLFYNYLFRSSVGNV